ncbi:MAG TPA: IS256 family transposase [Nitrososphaera sp.]|jgi:transposase-like protein|nr:IS256 family transposase [Nitrososphaera sp.]
MTYESNCTLPNELLAQIADEGLACLPELIQTLINTAMQIERQQHLGVGPYERSAERQGHANGYKPKTVTTRVGALTFNVPQVREGNFYPHALEKGLRSERALMLALAEMYVQGVSTRKVAAITEKLCGWEVSSTQVSHATSQLDSVLTQWRNRPLGPCPYLFLDARYEKVRIDGQVRDVAVLIACGVNCEGKRQILGVSVSLSEQEVHWRTFLQSLVARGLGGIHLVISDAHAGLKQARQAVFGAVPWQRCQFHLQQNAQAYVPRQEMKSEVAAAIRAIFNTPNRLEADSLLTKTVQLYAKRYPKLADWLEANLPEGLAVFDFPEAQRRLLRTTNGLERLNKEIKRRTRVVGIFPNEAACLRLVTALAMECSDEWETGKVYITLSPPL